MRFRGRPHGDDASPVANDNSFDHSSGHADLAALVGDHLLGPEAAAATAEWFPSRRGVSPRGDTGQRRRKNDPEVEHLAAAAHAALEPAESLDEPDASSTGTPSTV